MLGDRIGSGQPFAAAMARIVNSSICNCLADKCTKKKNEVKSINNEGIDDRERNEEKGRTVRFASAFGGTSTYGGVVRDGNNWDA